MEFDKLYENYFQTIYSYLFFKLRDKGLVEDLLQDTFLAAYQSINKAGPPQHPKTWLISIAHHKMVDYLRQKKPQQVNYLEDNFAAKTENPLDNVFLEELIQTLEGADQTIIYGLYIEELTYKELAEILELPLGTVKSKAHKARKVLRQWLERGNQ